MKILLVVALAVACTARPDIGLAYKSTGVYGSPSRTYIPQAQAFPAPHFQPSSSFQVNTHQVPNFNNGFNQGVSTSQVPAFNVFNNAQPNYYRGGQEQHTYRHQYNDASNVPIGSSEGFHQVKYEHIQHTGPIQVTKNAYFYDAPHDDSVAQTRVHVAHGPGKKNVNLVFVKAPAYAHNTQVIAPSQLNQEKTKIYVLVKKPEDGQDIHVPSIAPAAPSKPEVYYIKYKTQKEAEDKIHAIQQGAQGAANHASELGSEGAFVNSIARTANLRNNVGVTVQQVAHGAETVQETSHFNNGGVVASDHFDQHNNGGVVSSNHFDQHNNGGVASSGLFDQHNNGGVVTSTHFNQHNNGGAISSGHVDQHSHGAFNQHNHGVVSTEHGNGGFFGQHSTGGVISSSSSSGGVSNHEVISSGAPVSLPVHSSPVVTSTNVVSNAPSHSGSLVTDYHVSSDNPSPTNILSTSSSETHHNVDSHSGYAYKK